MAPPSTAPPSEIVMGFHGWFAETDDNAQFRSASTACQHLLPFGTPPGGETHQQFLSALESAECMRSHGYPNWPDPHPDAGGVWVPAGADTKSAQFQAAAKACGVPLPPGG